MRLPRWVASFLDRNHYLLETLSFRSRTHPLALFRKPFVFTHRKDGRWADLETKSPPPPSFQLHGGLSEFPQEKETLEAQHQVLWRWKRDSSR